jgi:starch-binding outer membrane protein, SusD/RagB family
MMPSMMNTGIGRRALVSAALLSLAVTLSCKPSEILDVTDPDVLNVDDYRSPQGADPLRNGVISDWQNVVAGSIDGLIVASGNMADEIRSTDTFEDRLSVSSRTVIENNPAMLATYRGLHRVHAAAERSIPVLQEFTPNAGSNIGELYALRGLTEIFFAELYCSGIPFSQEDGVTTTFGVPETTTEMLERAVGSFDTALAPTVTDARIRNIAAMGKGRALLNLGQFSAAAAAVATVPTSFKYETFHSTTAGRNENGIWNAVSVSVPRYTVIDREGINGLPYLQTPNDPRMPWVASTRVGFNSLHRNLPNQTKYGRTSSVIISDGVEARLIELEARLRGGTQADRDAVFAGLNELRATGRAGVVPAPMPGPAPTTQNAAVDLLFAERAYWMWLTGHRLGDLRRLVRQYQRSAESVFPTGPLAAPLAGSYGTDVNLIIPFEERNNPNFTGCLDRNA